MPRATPLSIDRGFSTLTLAPARTARSDDIDDAFCQLAPYRDGGVFLAHYAGHSEWERHSKGDEIVMMVEGEATIFLWIDGKEEAHRLHSGELIVVPENTWHRFETTAPVKVLTVTPQPTDHRTECPE